jgi:hypothetical protein
VRLNCLVATLFLVHLSPSLAFAESITFSFAGTVDGVDPVLASAFSVGDPLTGTLVFDSNATPAANCLDIAAKSYCTPYESPAQSLLATLGSSYEFFGNVFVIQNTPPVGPPDAWGVVANPPLHLSSLTGPPVNGNVLTLFDLTLVDDSGTALDNALVPPVFANYSSGTFVLAFVDANLGGSYFVGGPITSLNPIATPEPPTALLMLAGVAGALGVRRLRRVRV